MKKNTLRKIYEHRNLKMNMNTDEYSDMLFFSLNANFFSFRSIIGIQNSSSIIFKTLHSAP